MRHSIFTCALALAIGCAAQSSHAAEPAAAPTPPAPTESAAPAAAETPATPAAPTPAQAAAEDEKKDAEFARVAKTYRQMEKDGQKFYCRNEKKLGTRLPSPVCLTEAQLWERINKAEDIRDEMRAPKQGACGTSNAVC